MDTPQQRPPAQDGQGGASTIDLNQDSPAKAGAQVLSLQHKKLIDDSGISPEVAAARGYRSVTIKAELGRMGFGVHQLIVPTLLVPIFGVDGDLVGYQHRPDSPRMKKGKPIKYESPTGGCNVLDVPPAVRELLGNPSIPLYITEGARKADSAASRGLCCVSITGVWGWRGRNEHDGKVALPDWHSVALNGRTVYLAFDNDSATNQKVHHALSAFKDFLESKEAKVRIINLPSGENGAKVGLDDYLAAGHSVDELLALASDKLPPQPRREGEAWAGPYVVSNGVICRERQTREGPITEPLCNFNAWISAIEIRDNGQDSSTVYALEGKDKEGRPLPLVTVKVSQFSTLNWIGDAWTVRAIVFADFGCANHLRSAILHFSNGAPQRTVYTHLGWRKIDDEMLYLHAGGAICGNAEAPAVHTDPPTALRDFQLPPAPAGDDLHKAVRASLSLLDLAPHEVVLPLLAAVYRAPLGEVLPVDLSLFLAGSTGSQKTELTALAQAHYGAEFNGRNLPANWSGTANALESIAFHAKDALLVVDDFCPQGTPADQQRLHREADRLLRGQGNRAGRARMYASGDLRPEFFPRGLIISSGEDIPRGHSLRARLMILQTTPRKVDLNLLTVAQEAAADGLLASAMAAYLKWLAPQMDSLKSTLPAWHRELRSAARADGVTHDRTPDNMTSLAIGWDTFLRFARESGAISAEETKALWKAGWVTLAEVAKSQAEYQRDEDPAAQFISLLIGAISGGFAHIASALTGEAPTVDATHWGWRRAGREGIEWQPQGVRIGWLDGDDLYLEPGAAFAAVQRLARDQGINLPIGQTTLWKRLREKDLLISWDAERQRNVTRKSIMGIRQQVVHISAAHIVLKTVPTVPTVPGGEGIGPIGTTGTEIDSIGAEDFECDGVTPPVETTLSWRDEL